MKPIHVKFAHNSLGRFFSYKMLSKKDKKTLKKHPKKLMFEGYKSSRVLKDSFKKRGFFSISHKGEFSMVGFSKKGGFGVDLESFKTRDFDAVIEFCFNEDEKRLYAKSEDKMLFFYKIYTAKEAIIKAKNLNFWDLARVGYNRDKNSFCDENNKKIYIFHQFFKKDMIFCVSFKEKRDIILHV